MNNESDNNSQSPEEQSFHEEISKDAPEHSLTSNDVPDAEPVIMNEADDASSTFEKRSPRKEFSRDRDNARDRDAPKKSFASKGAPVHVEDDGSERIAKRLARAGIASRRDAESMIAAGRISVNGKKLDTPAFTVKKTDMISVDGKPLKQTERTRLWLYHKPAGLVTTNRDPEGRPTVFDNLPAELPRVLSIGRLDINTEGLLLLTNDGGLARILELPSTGWVRRYRVRAHGKVTQAALDELKNGIAIDGVFYGSVDAKIEREQGTNTWISVALREGKNREVKNIMGALGLSVNRLIRVSFGPFQLGDLEESMVKEIKGRTLRDQLGERLIEEANADFEAPILNPFSNEPIKAEQPADYAQELQSDWVAASPRTRKADDAPREKYEPRARNVNVWMAPGARPRSVRDEETGPKRRAPRREYGASDRSDYQKTDAEKSFRPREDGERSFRPRDGGDRKPYGERSSGGFDRKPRGDGERSFERRAPRQDGERSFRPREDGERSFRPRDGGDRKPYSGGDRKPYGERSSGGFDRKPRGDGERSFERRAPRQDGERSFRPREDGERSFRPRDGGDRKPYSGGDRKPYGERSSGGFDRKPRGDGERNFERRAPRQDGERSFRPREDGERSFRPRDGGDRKPYSGGGDRKPYSGGDRKPYGERSSGGFDRKPRGDGERSFRPREDGERSFKPRDGGDRKPYSGGGDRKPYSGGDRKPYGERSSGGFDRKPRGDGERSFRPREDGERSFRPRDGGDRKPYSGGDRKPYGERSSGGFDRKPRGDGERSFRPKDGGDRKPYSGGDRKPYGDRSSGNDRPPRRDGASSRPAGRSFNKPVRGR